MAKTPDQFQPDDEKRILEIESDFNQTFARETDGWIKSRYLKTRGKPLPSPGKPDTANELFGVALSGGGMRSGTYCAGVMQALARGGMLREVDYLSTVSGGGYFGSSLSALWSPSPEVPNVSNPLGVEPDNFPYQFPGFAGGTIGGSPAHGLESAALRHVREKANMLASGPGVLNLETWTGAARYLGLTTISWALYPVAWITLLFLATMFIPESRWDRFSPFDARGDWHSIHILAALAPAFSFGGFVLLSLIPSPDEARLRTPWHAAVRFMRAVLMGTTLVTLSALLMVLAVWGYHSALVQEGGWSGRGLEVILAAGATGSGVLSAIGARAVSVASANRLKVGAAVLMVGGVALIIFGLVAWYHFLWAVAYPSSENLGMAGMDWYGRWRFVIYGFTFAGAAVLVTTVLGPRVLNFLSLSQLYLRRIQRTWIIGPGREGKHIADGWRSVAIRDRLKVSNLDGSAGRSPYHLVCAALNISGSSGPELLDRKADSFVISKHTVGSSVTGWKDSSEGHANLSLSAAATMSGAAVSPNMGARTSSTLSVIFTLFNVRIGQWIRNPRRSSGLLGVVGPWIRPDLYWREMFGKASAKDPWVYISDGGHFDNLGLYELFRRRCKYIIAVDGSGEDPTEERTFGSLGTALRRARVDLGVEVDIDVSKLDRVGDNQYVGAHIAVGRIRYQTGMGHGSGYTDDTDSGVFVYIRSGLVDGTLTPDLVEYVRARNPKFPHDPTSDVQYDQPQFESYRQLGYIAGREVTRRAGDQQLKSRFEALLRSV